MANSKEILNRRRGRQGFRTLCCGVFGLLKNQFLRNNNNKGSRSNVNKHKLVYGESSYNARDAPDVCSSFVLLFTIFVIVVTQNLVLQQSKNLKAKCTETLSPPPCIQFSLINIKPAHDCKVKIFSTMFTVKEHLPVYCISS